VSEKGVLFLVVGDPLSEKIRKDAAEASFEGTIVSLSMEEAQSQRTPLPLLSVGLKTLGPTSLLEYFRPAWRGASRP
jgi:hypothetical protein